MPFEIVFHDPAGEELEAIRVFDRRKITHAIEQQLRHLPTTSTRNRKPLGTLEVPFAHEGPVWELRVAEYRVFYEVNEELEQVQVRTIRRKGRSQTTEDIL